MQVGVRATASLRPRRSQLRQARRDTTLSAATWRTQRHPLKSPEEGVRGRNAFLGTLNLLYVVLVTSFLLMVTVVQALVRPAFAWDFRAFYDAGHQYLYLHSPYVSGSLAAMTSRENFVYPLPLAAIFAPVSLIPYPLAAALFVAINAVLLALALRLLDVRDWRCYLAALIGVPSVVGIGLGTISPLLVFLLAVLWRFRDRGRVAVPVLALLVLAKLFLWPVGLWFLFTRRFRTALAALITCAAAVFLSALPLGIGPLWHYPALLRALSSVEGPSSFSLTSLGMGVGGSYLAGSVLSLAVGLLLSIDILRSARLRDDSRAFRLAIVAALAMSPIVWNHYLVLMFVPLALIRPRFSPLWVASAWIYDGGFLAPRQLLVLTIAVWLVIVAQGGVLPAIPADMRLRLRRLYPAFRLAGSLCLWAGILWMIGLLAGAVPAVAALTPTRADRQASGTATLRLIKGRNEICWNVVSTRLPAGSRTEILRSRPSLVLAEHAMRAGRSYTCSDVVSTVNVADAFKKHGLHLLLRIVSPAGRILLSGNVVFPSDAGSAHT
jgi:alpha-1,2-mannosyltransferase